MPEVTVTELSVEGVRFPSAVKPRGSPNIHFLGGAGVRGLEIGEKFLKFTAIGVYLESTAVAALAGKWKGKSAEELVASVDFFRDIVTGPFEKFTRVTMILPLTGLQYSEKVAENCTKFWKSAGIYTDAEAEAIEKFKLTFKDHNFPPGSSILFTHSPSGALTVAFSSDDGSVSETEGSEVIENRPLAEAVLDSIIGEHGVSPEAKKSLASRLAELLATRDEENRVVV